MSAAEKLAAAVRRAHVDGEGLQPDCEVCQALKEFENQKPQDWMCEAAEEILQGSEHNAVRWHGPDADNQWCWQYRDAGHLAAIIAKHAPRPHATEMPEVRQSG